MELATQVQILDKAVCISLYANSYRNGWNPSVLPPNYCSITVPKVPELQPHYQMQFNITQEIAGDIVGSPPPAGKESPGEGSKDPSFSPSPAMGKQ